MRLAISTTETLTDLKTDLVVANNNNNDEYELPLKVIASFSASRFALPSFPLIVFHSLMSRMLCLMLMVLRVYGKFLNVENDWDGEVDCPEVMGPCFLLLDEGVAAVIKGLKIGKAAGPTGVMSEIMKASDGFGTRWMTDLSSNCLFTTHMQISSQFSKPSSPLKSKHPKYITSQQCER